MDEVLAQTSPAIEDFLLKTAILDRMCGPLCATLLGGDAQEGCSQTRLDAYSDGWPTLLYRLDGG